MRPLIIDELAREKIRKLILNAEQNVIKIDETLDIFNLQAPIVGDRKGFSCTLPIGYRVVYSIEEHPNNKREIKKVRHISISIDSPGKLPNPAAVETLIKEIGFKNEMHDCMIKVREDCIEVAEEI